MKFAFPWGRNTGFWLAVMFAGLAGTWLRLYLIQDQVLIDDEWHGFYYALGKSPGWLLTHFSIPGATCIPLNFYTWALGANGGWSETALRLPSLTFGILLIVVGPLLARPLLGRRRSALLALLLAISPMLIFYSRIARPYSAVAFLSFVALLLGARWQQAGGTRRAVLFIVAGALAIYFHLFAVIAVGAPILVALLFQGWSRWIKPRAGGNRGPSARAWLIVGGAIAILSAILVLPALIQSMRSTFFTIATAGRVEAQSIPKAAMLVSGTGQPVLAILFWLAVAAGAVEQTRRNPWFGTMLLSLYPLHALALIISRPDGGQSAIVVARYCIPLVPVSALFAACGIRRALEATRVAMKPALQTAAAGAFVGALAFGGPLPQCYVSPNSFTNHGAFQHRYAPIDWRTSFASDIAPRGFTLRTAIRVEEVSPFYADLLQHPGPRPIVEYPMLIGDHFNPLYYYQHFHHRRVLVGYTTNLVTQVGLAAGNIYGNTCIDQVMSFIHDGALVRFHNMLAMDDIAAMRREGVEYVILHKQYEAELSGIVVAPPDLERLANEYRKALGAPAYEDAHLVAFRF